MEALVTLEGVSKTKGPRWILQDISLQIPKGESFAIVGRNGSGKSTLVKILCGLWAPTRGRLAWDSSLDRGLGIVLQDSFIDGFLTIRENLHFIAMVRRTDEFLLIELVRRALVRLGVYLDLDMEVRRLSGGQRRIVELLSILVQDHSVILMDEPLSNVDLRIKSRVLEFIRERVEQSNASLLLCTHDQAEFELAQKYVLLGSGKVIETGAVANSPLHRLIIE